MFDTHTHLNFKAFENSLDAVITESKEAGVEQMIVVGTNLENSQRAVEIAQKYEGIYASVGLHPHHVFAFLETEGIKTGSSPETFLSKGQRREAIGNSIYNAKLADPTALRLMPKSLTVLLSLPKVVAVGETGMDRHIYQKTKYQNYQITQQFITLQKWFFQKQIQLAIKHHKSLIIHNREAVADTLEVLQKNWNHKLSGRAVFHFCEPDQRLLDFAIKNHVYIGVGGDVLYDKIKQEFVKKVPLELLVLETDSPYIIPEPFKSSIEIIKKPKNLKFILQIVSQLLNIKRSNLETALDNNIMLLFLRNDYTNSSTRR